MAGNVVEITESNFGTAVEKATQPVLLDFWAEWCGPCIQMGPLIEQVADELNGKVVVGKVNIDNERNLGIKFNIRSIPTLVVVKNGQEVRRQVGLVPKGQILSLLEEHVS